MKLMTVKDVQNKDFPLGFIISAFLQKNFIPHKETHKIFYFQKKIIFGSCGQQYLFLYKGNKYYLMKMFGSLHCQW